MNRCLGCGKELPDGNKYCERCFQIKNYNNQDNNVEMLSNDEIIKKVNEYHTFTLFLCDFLNLNQKVINYYKQINNQKIFILTKMDIIPKNVSLDQFVDNLKRVYSLDRLMLLSIKNNYNIKELNELIENEQQVLLIGPASSGKSSLINYLFKTELTVSNKQNTTLAFNEFMINDIKVIDSPGFQVNKNLVSKQAGYLRPIIINLKKDYMLEINEYKLSFDKEVNITLFLDKNTIYKTLKKELLTNDIIINNKSDLVIDNLGFIYFKNGCKGYLNKLDNVENRESLVA